MGLACSRPHCNSRCRSGDCGASTFSTLRAGSWSLELPSTTRAAWLKQDRDRELSSTQTFSSKTAFQTLFFAGQKSQNPAGKFVRESQAGFGPGIEIDGLLVGPNQELFLPGVAGPREIIRGVGGGFRALLNRIVIECQTFSCHAFRTTQRIRETVQGALVGGENHGVI